MSSCDFHVVLYLYSGIDATSTLLWDYAAMKAVWDHTRSFLRHHCRLSFALTGACDIIVVLRHHCRSLRHSCRLVANCHLPTPVGSCCFIRRSSERPKLVSILAASSPTCCGIIADFHLRSQALATSLSSVSCCFLESSVRPLQGLSCGIMPTFICAHRRLRLHCRLTTSLSFIAALMPTCG